MNLKLHVKENIVSALNLNSDAAMANAYRHGGVAIMKTVNLSHTEISLLNNSRVNFNNLFFASFWDALQIVVILGKYMLQLEFL